MTARVATQRVQKLAPPLSSLLLGGGGLDEPMNERREREGAGSNPDGAQSGGGVDGRIKSVRGRRSPGSPKGLPPVARMTLGTGLGDLELSLPTPPGERTPGRVRAIIDPAPQTSPCPICLKADATEREHVPQQGLGGKVMLYTCRACNNGFGSRVEIELQHFYDRALVDVKIAVPSLEGARKAPRILHRRSADGLDFLVFDAGRFDPELEREMEHFGDIGHFQLLYREPDEGAVKVAALKHAYLAACLSLRMVPSTARADAIRAELMEALNQPHGRPLRAGPIARSLPVHITGMDPIPHSVLVVDWQGPQEAILTEILLAGTLRVGWPLETELLKEVDRISAERDAKIRAARKAAGLPN